MNFHETGELRIVFRHGALSFARNSPRMHTGRASNPRFLDPWFPGPGNERGERNLTAELEVARSRRVAGIFAGCETIGARHCTYLLVYP